MEFGPFAQKHLQPLTLQLMRRMSYNAEEGSWSLRAVAAAAPTRAEQASAVRRPASARQVLFLDTEGAHPSSPDFASIQWMPTGM